MPREAFEKVMPYTNIFLYDIKAISEDVHIKCTSQPNQIILENLKYIDSCNKPIEVRIPFVPQFNADEIENIGRFLGEIKNLTKVRVLAYHNFAGSKYEALPENEALSKEAEILNKYI